MVKKSKAPEEGKKSKGYASLKQRSDVGVPWDKEWLKKSRDDVKTTNEPLPDNPLLKLRPVKAENKGEDKSGKGSK